MRLIDIGLNAIQIDPSQHKGTLAALGAVAMGAAALGVARVRLLCNDGTSMSMVGSMGHYSEPRDDDARSYSEVEVGMHNPAGAWVTDDPVLGETTDSVYGWVPVGKIGDLIQAHGGIQSIGSNQETAYAPGASPDVATFVKFPIDDDRAQAAEPPPASGGIVPAVVIAGGTGLVAGYLLAKRT